MKILKRGDEMTGLLLIFAACVAVMFVAVYVYNKADDTAYDKVQKSFAAYKVDQEILLDEISKRANEAATLSANHESTIAELVKRVDEMEAEIDRAQDHFEKLRGQQFDLQNTISKKRPIVKMPSGPIQVEIYSKPAAVSPTPKRKPLGRGVKSLLNERGN